MSTGLAGWLDNLPVIRDHENGVIIKNPKRKRRDTSLIILRLEPSVLWVGKNAAL